MQCFQILATATEKARLTIADSLKDVKPDTTRRLVAYPQSTQDDSNVILSSVVAIAIMQGKRAAAT